MITALFLVFIVLGFVQSARRPKDALRCLVITVIAEFLIGIFCGLGVLLPLLFLFLYPFFFSFFYHWQTAAGCLVFIIVSHLIASPYVPEVLMLALITVPSMYVCTYLLTTCVMLAVKTIRKRRRENKTFNKTAFVREPPEEKPFMAAPLYRTSLTMNRGKAFILSHCL